MHLPNLVYDLGLILASASFVSLIFKRFGQPQVLGYLFAGFLVGPHFEYIPSVKEVDSIKVWAEIGIIFLLFALGLEFSFKKMAKVGGGAITTAVIETTGMFMIGYFVGQTLNWSNINSLFLGGMLAISSTAIILKTFDELGYKNQKFVSHVFGVLVIEDLIAIILMVAFSTLALTNELQGPQLAFTLVKLALFITAWFFAGIVLLPLFLKKMQKHFNEESILLFSIACCFLLVIQAVSFGFSPALGAFVMGSVFSGTGLVNKIEENIKPIKALFSAVFFVSVGMLINPAVIASDWPLILGLSAIVIIFKSGLSTIGSLSSGMGFKNSILSGAALSQIGEFSFIIATIGQIYGVISDNLYPIIVVVSAVSTFTTPYLIKSAPQVESLAKSFLPVKVVSFLNDYSFSAVKLSSNQLWFQLLKSYVKKIILFASIITIILLVLNIYLDQYIEQISDIEWLTKSIHILVGVVLVSPFLWALALKPFDTQVVKELWNDKWMRGPVLLLELLRHVVTTLILIVFLSKFIHSYWFLVFALIVVAVVVYLFSSRLNTMFIWFERRFHDHYFEDSQSLRSTSPDLAPWEAHIAVIDIPQDSDQLGLSLYELKAREKFGVIVVMIERGGVKIPAPSRDEKLYPYDKVYVVGSDSQVEHFQSFIESHDRTEAESQAIPNEFQLKPIVLEEDSNLVGKTIIGSQIREQTLGLVVGVERDGKRVISPQADYKFEAGDLVWVFGDHKKLENLFFKPATS